MGWVLPGSLPAWLAGCLGRWPGLLAGLRACAGACRSCSCTKVAATCPPHTHTAVTVHPSLPPASHSSCPPTPPRLPACSGELYPVETDERLCDVLQTGQEVEVDMVNDVLTDLATGKKYSLKPLGDVSGPACLAVLAGWCGWVGGCLEGGLL